MKDKELLYENLCKLYDKKRIGKIYRNHTNLHIGFIIYDMKIKKNKINELQFNGDFNKNLLDLPIKITIKYPFQDIKNYEILIFPYIKNITVKQYLLKLSFNNIENLLESLEEYFEYNIIEDELYQKHKAKLLNDFSKPYLEYEYKIIKRMYNPNYGDERICICGHTYERHFDSYENMYSCGCKYCECNNFIEKEN